MFSPTYDQSFHDFGDMEEIVLPGSERAIMVRALAIGNFAISKSGKVYAWSIIDHPITTKKIRTKPIHLGALDQFSNKYDLVPADNNCTRLYYRENTGKDLRTGFAIIEDKFVDIPNDQIYVIIMESCFSEEELIQLTQTIADAAGN
jgi:hypothetical protein